MGKKHGRRQPGNAGHLLFRHEALPMQPEATAADLYDVYLPYLPEKEELDRLDDLLAGMLAKAQAELERLSPVSR
jgi:hypothetical protein